MLTTTSGSQKSNWRAMFEQASGKRAARGLVLAANQYNPGLSPSWVKAQREQGFPTTVAGWRDNLAVFAAQGRPSRCPDDSFAVSIVDEAHALIDPTAPGKEGVAPSGWAMHAGPQAWHIIRSSRVSVFLMDSAQSYRDNETTTRTALERYARDFGVDAVEFVSLEGQQFRCAGAAEYLDWLDATLHLRDDPDANLRWWSRRGGPFEFELVDSPFQLEDRLREHLADGHTARLLASYARPWRTKKAVEPHALAPYDQDFHIRCDHVEPDATWSRVWNYAPDQDYTLFVQAPPGSYMAEDPLSEVGCPYVVRGFDFDYVGLLWLEDLLWRGDRWVVDPDQVHETAWRKTLAAVKREAAPGPAAADLADRLRRGYRILLSRAIRGAYVWCADPETRAHLARALGSTDS